MRIFVEEMKLTEALSILLAISLNSLTASAIPLNINDEGLHDNNITRDI